MKFEGGKELAATLAGLSTRLKRSVVKEALIGAAEPMRLRMQRLAPVEPGAPDLADNIIVSGGRGGTDSEGTEKAQTVSIGPAKGFFYARFQEYGTVHHGAQPFMRPAFDSEAPKVIQKLAAAVWVELAGKGINRPMVDAVGPVIGGPGGSTL